MKISLVFMDWKDDKGKSFYSTELGITLSSANLHSGSTFQASIELDEDDRLTLETAILLGLKPVFYTTLSKEDQERHDALPF